MAGKITFKVPIEKASGKIFGEKSNVSLRANKNKEGSRTYTWPENYVYPQIPARQHETQRLREASLKYKEVAADPAKLKVFEDEFRKNKGRLNGKGKQYTDLRHFVIGWYMQQSKNGGVEM